MRHGERDQPVQALAPNRADDPLADRIGRRRPGWRLHHGQSESADGLVQMLGKDAIAIVEEVSVTVTKPSAGSDEPVIFVSGSVPADVVQAILGHASLQTTSIYVRAERRRMLEAAARYYANDASGA